MKKLHLSLAGAALTALLLAGCTQASAASGTVSAPKAMTTPAPQSEASPSESTASAPVAAPASQPTTSIAGSADPNSGYIGEDAAKTAALEHAGLTEADLQAVVIRLDYDDGRALYDVEFVRPTDTGAEEYDYEIDALTGEIFAYDYDAENYGGTAASSAAGSTVTADQAKQIALQHAGVAEGDIRALEMETDTDHGKTVYEFSWKVGFTEYDYEIDAETGAILSFSQEQDD